MTSDRRRRRLEGRKAMIDALRGQTGEYFKRMRFETRPGVPYLLARQSQWSENIIEPRVADFIRLQIATRKGQGKHFALHSYIHHGLSSQAMLWNLLGPLIVDERWDLLNEIVSAAGLSRGRQIVGAEFEYEDADVLGEHGGQPTSVDLLLRTSEGPPILVEFKFTEAEFGGCSVFADGDCDGRNPALDHDLCYLHRIGRTYWPLMEKHGVLAGSLVSDSQCPMTSLYQAYRLVLFAAEADGALLLLYDERNPAFVKDEGGLQRGLWERVRSSLPKAVAQRCGALSIQQVVNLLDSHGDLDWLSEVRAKYM